MSLTIKTSLPYWIAAFISIVGITIFVHTALPHQTHPEIFYGLGIIWTLFFSFLLFSLYRKDIENESQLEMVRFADVSSALAFELRKTVALILKSQQQAEIKTNAAAGVRVALNLAHEYYSFVTGQYCTASVAVITTSKSGNNRLVCEITQHDDFVLITRKIKEIEIPLEDSLFGYIKERDLKAVVIDDYTKSKYPIYSVPIIEEGFCISGICVPIKLFGDVVAFFNIDSTKPNVFKPNSHEQVASFFAELLGLLGQVEEHRLNEVTNVEEDARGLFRQVPQASLT